MATTKLSVREYLTNRAVSPFREWLTGLDATARARIQAIDFGPGYRICFGRSGSAIVLLLLGGDKSTPRADVRRARDYRSDYREATNRGKTK